MPVPLIDLQRRLAIVGAVRVGGEKQPHAPGRKLEAFRVTTPRRELAEQAAQLYGGAVAPWQSPTGAEWQVYTEAEELPVLVMPSYSLRQSYELWLGATKRERLCDGVDEELSGGPCICNRDGVEACDLYTRFVIALPELATALGWKLITKSANAAHELPTMLALMQARTPDAAFVPARLRLDQRRGVKDGQVVRFVVPVLDMGLSYLEMAQQPQRQALPPADSRAWQPVTPSIPSAADALDSLSAPRQASTLPDLPEPDVDFAPAPEPPDDGTVEQPQDEYSERRQTLWLTEPQASKLNVLVGKLRDGGHVTTESLWMAVGLNMRGVEVGPMIDQLGGRDGDGVLHWAPLRNSLTRPEANQLIDWLQTKAQRVGID